MSETQVAIVTGGVQGIGAAICIALLERGYKVCVADIQEKKGRDFVEEQQKKYGEENVIFSLCDVTKESDYQNAFELTIKVFKKVNVLVNNAGIASERNPRRTIDVNLMGPITGCQMAFKYMGKSSGHKNGIVINTASLAGLVPLYVAPVYTASKHAVIGLTRSYGLPYYWEKKGIIFAALCPSFTDTEILSNLEIGDLIKGFDATGREYLMSPEYVAKGVLKILEDRINGSTLLVTKENGYQYIGVQEELKNIPLE